MLSRRQFLVRSAAGLAILPGASALIAACSSSSTKSSPTTKHSVAGSSTAPPAGPEGLIGTPGNAVKLPIYDDNKAIADGLKPEAGPLTILNYADYVSPDVVKAFETKYGVKVEITPFDADSDLVEKVRTGALTGDLILSASYDTYYKMVAAKLVQPLNHSYLPNFVNVLPALQDPFYDSGSKYTVPYTLYALGLDYRTDEIDPATVAAKGWELLWDPKYKGKISVLNNDRESIAAALLRKGIVDLNTTDATVIAQAGSDLKELVASNVKVTIDTYKNVPTDVTTIGEGYSGDMINAIGQLPQGTDAKVLGFWKPEIGKLAVNNDFQTVLKAAKNPVLAHLFINFIIDNENAFSNFAFTGYQPALAATSADELIKRQLVPETLRSCLLSNEEVAKGLRIHALPLDKAKLYETAYSTFNAG